MSTVCKVKRFKSAEKEALSIVLGLARNFPELALDDDSEVDCPGVVGWIANEFLHYKTEGTAIGEMLRLELES